MQPETNKSGPLLGIDGKPVNLTTFALDAQRISLRPISMEYAEDIFREFTRRITRYMGPKPPERIDEIQDFIRSALTGLRSGEELQLVILKRNTGEFLGCCGLHGKGKREHPELGVWVKESAHGNGYGKEAVVALKRWADANLHYDYLTYPVDRRNIPSRRIPEALGGVIFEERQLTKQDGTVLDEVVYRILSNRSNR